MERVKGGIGDYGIRASLYAYGRFTWPKWIFNELKDRLGRRVVYPGIDLLKVLDVGCGTGVSTRQLHQVGFSELIGIDIDPRMIKVAKKKSSGERYAVCSLESQSINNYLREMGNIPDHWRWWDVVTAFGCLTWIEYLHDPIEVIGNELINTKGIFLAANEDRIHEDDRWKELKRRFAPDAPELPKTNPTALERLLKKHFFVDIETIQKKEYVVIPTKKAAAYIMAGSWVNYVESGNLPALQSEVRRELGTRRKVRWEMEFTATFARVPFYRGPR